MCQLLGAPLLVMLVPDFFPPPLLPFTASQDDLQHHYAPLELMALGSSSAVDCLDAAMAAAGAAVDEDLALTVPLCEHPGFQVAGEGALFGMC
jgi:hypothetical protein